MMIITGNPSDCCIVDRWPILLNKTEPYTDI